MSQLSKRYVKFKDRHSQRRLHSLQTKMVACDKKRNDYAQRQELQRRAMVLIAECPLYRPRKRWWL
jgi:hypothetical protein